MPTLRLFLAGDIEALTRRKPAGHIAVRSCRPG